MATVVALLAERLWLCWQSGCFERQTAAVRIQSSLLEIAFEKKKMKKKRPIIVHF